MPCVSRGPENDSAPHDVSQDIRLSREWEEHSRMLFGLAHHDSSGTGHCLKEDTEGPRPMVTQGLLLEAPLATGTAPAFFSAERRLHPNHRPYLVRKADRYPHR